MFRAKKKHNRVRDWSNQHESRQWVLNEADTTTDQHDNSPLLGASLRLCRSSDSLSFDAADVGDVMELDRQSLTTDVDRFSQAVSQLKTTLSSVPGSGYCERAIDAGSSGSSRERVDQAEQPTVSERAADLVRWLGEVKTVVISVLNRHPRVHSTGIFSSLGSLMSKFKEHSEERVENVPGALEALEQLTQAFITSVTEYMQGEIVDPRSLPIPGISRESSMDSILSALQENGNARGAFSPPESPQSRVLSPSSDKVANEACQALMRLENGMDILLKYCKSWSRYVKELTGFVEKTSQCKVDHCSRMMKMTRGMRETLVEMDGFGLPFCSSFNTWLEQDLDLYRRWHDTFKSQVFVKFVEPLNQHRDEHEKTRKSIKETWKAHQKKVAESVGHLKKSYSRYVQLCDDRDRAGAKAAQMEKDETVTLAKLEKKKQQEEDLKIRANDAEYVYKQCVNDANQCLANMETFRNRTLDSMCHAFIRDEYLLKATMLDYAHLERDLVANVADEISRIADGISSYPLCSQLVDTLHSQSELNQAVNEDGTSSAVQTFASFGRYPYEPYGFAGNKRRSASDPDLTRPDIDIPTPSRSYTITESLPFMMSPSRKPGGLASLTAKLTTMVTGNKETDEMGSKKTLSVPDKLLVLRPPGQRVKRPSSIAGPLADGIRVNEDGVLTVDVGDRSPARRLKRKVRRGQFRPKDADTSHLTPDDALSGPQRKRTNLSRRPTFFGVDLSRQLRITGRPVPLLVSKCVAELNERGLRTQGLYRVPAAQSKIKDLCRKFETNAEGVDLSDTHSHVMASVLKFYLRQLPQPLLTFKLYPQFVAIAKKWQSEQTHRRLRKSPKTSRSHYSLHSDSSGPFPDMIEKDSSLPRSTSQGVFPRSNSKGDSPEAEGEVEMLNPLVAELKAIVDQLSPPYYHTAATLINHLTEVAAHEAENQMSASNLAIVFGPNILRPRSEIEASMSTLIEMQHQLKAVEMLIRHSEVFTRVPTNGADTKEITLNEEANIIDDSSEEENFVRPCLRRHSSADILSNPAINTGTPGTPPLRKRQSMTELEDLFSLVAGANKMRLNTQRTKAGYDLEHDDTPKEKRRQRYADEFEALQSEMFGDQTNISTLHRRLSDSDGADPLLLPGAVTDDHSFSSKPALTPPMRLSPLSHSLVEHFDLNIRTATSPGVSTSYTVMREAARAAQSTEMAVNKLTAGLSGVQDQSLEEVRRVKSQSPASSPTTKTAARRSESDATSHMSTHKLTAQSHVYSDKFTEQPSDEDEEEGSSVLELLITGSPQLHSHRPCTFVSAATVAHKMHTTTLEEDVERASDHTHTCTATLTPSESAGVDRSTASLASLREDISGLMQRFDEQISVLETPPGSPAFIRRRHQNRMKHKKTKSFDSLASKVITMSKKPVDSAVQSMDSLLSTSEELLASPRSTDSRLVASATNSRSHPSITVDTEEEPMTVQVKTEWRVEESSDLSPVNDRDSGISEHPHSGTTASARTPETSPVPVPKRKTRKPEFV
ncbi:rho GTPase-activating protein 29-like isoform X3 [Corticium candelabrum]|uniref:rho GTPase-activating protein 29-like isoform X3 n=1 Tax=Corticium candelabrum TaxID=121492 RepID=UPI002E26E749|nr:rho GTPase-activating protein 29-like isoform X3 [Corticium candelabrum]